VSGSYTILKMSAMMLFEARWLFDITTTYFYLPVAIENKEVSWVYDVFPEPRERQIIYF